jgi:hypothetical protein
LPFPFAVLSGGDIAHGEILDADLVERGCAAEHVQRDSTWGAFDKQNNPTPPIQNNRV